MSEWISAKDKSPVLGKPVFFTRWCAGERIVTYGFRYTHHWHDKHNGYSIDDEEVELWQYMALPEAPKPKGPFSIVGVGEKGWAINTQARYSNACYVGCNLELANHICDWFNREWLENHE